MYGLLHKVTINQLIMIQKIKNKKQKTKRKKKKEKKKDVSILNDVHQKLFFFNINYPIDNINKQRNKEKRVYIITSCVCVHCLVPGWLEGVCY